MVDATLTYASDSAYNVTLYNAEVQQSGIDHIMLNIAPGVDLVDSAGIQTARTTPSRVWDVVATPVGYLEKYRLEQNWKLTHVLTFTAPMTYDSGGVSATATVIISNAPIFSFPKIQDSTRKLMVTLKLVEVA
jgi:hypothetical protein